MQTSNLFSFRIEEIVLDTYEDTMRRFRLYGHLLHQHHPHSLTIKVLKQKSIQAV